MIAIVPILIVLVGWIAGIVVNYFSDVLPYSRSLTQPRCLHCEEPLKLNDYLFAWRRCTNCKNTRKIRTWLVEASFVLIALWLWYQPQEKLGFVAGLIILVYFGSVVVMDVEHRVILHPVSIAGALLMLIIGIWQRGLLATVFGGAVGFGVMYALYYFGDAFARWMAKRRNQEFDDVALGFGDVNLAGVLGLLMGWPGIAGGLILGILAGGAYSFFYIVYKLAKRSYSAFSTIPYGPFLIFGAVALLYY